MSALAHRRSSLPRERRYVLGIEPEEAIRRIAGAAFDTHSFERLRGFRFVLNAEPAADKTGASVVGTVVSTSAGCELHVRPHWRPTPTQLRLKLLVLAGVFGLVGLMAALTSHFSWSALTGGLTGMALGGWTWGRDGRRLQRLTLLQLVERAVDDARIRPDLGPFRPLPGR